MNYTGLDEVVVSFIDDLLYYALIFGIGIIINLWHENLPEKKIQALQESLKKLQPSSSTNLAEISKRISNIYQKIIAVCSKKTDLPNYNKIIEILQAQSNNHKVWHKNNLNFLEQIGPNPIEIDLEKSNQLKLKKENLIKEIEKTLGDQEAILEIIDSSFQSLDIKTKKRKFLFLILLFSIGLVILLLVPLPYSLKFGILSLFIYVFLMIIWLISQDTLFEINYYAMISFTIIIYTICGAYKDSYLAKEDSRKITISVKLKDNTEIKTDSNNIFLGKTNNYIFFYNLTEKESQVYNSSDIYTIKTRKSH